MSSKYRNVKTEVDGITFDSKKEANRYVELKLLEKAGEIYDLELQPKLPVEINGKKICDYVGDFGYHTTGAFAVPVLEDVKSPITRKNRTYRLKKKLVEAVYGITIIEV